MPCTRPLTAYRTGDGQVVFEPPGRPLQLPCGQCQDCRLQRSAEWATRLTHEQQLHERSSFLTLTYADDHLPADQGLCLRDTQLFIKRARQELGQLRYYLCGEYGERTNRPHYHMALFGHDFHQDRELVERNFQGDPVYKSEWLDWIWKKGGCRIGNLTTQSAGYVARYCMKKVTGARAPSHYGAKRPDFATMSLKPGIGAGWLDKFKTDVYPVDEVVINGARRRVPRFYDKRLPEKELEPIKAERVKRASAHKEDLTPERLIVRERVIQARLSQLKRT